MIDKEHRLPIGRQARLLSLNRGSVYYLPRPVPAADLAVMNRIVADLSLDKAMLQDVLSKKF